MGLYETICELGLIRVTKSSHLSEAAPMVGARPGKASWWTELSR